MRAVVIGGSGQIGGWLLRWLAERSAFADQFEAHFGWYFTIKSGRWHYESGGLQFRERANRSFERFPSDRDIGVMHRFTGRSNSEPPRRLRLLREATWLLAVLRRL